jgi:hypothetical protein
MKFGDNSVMALGVVLWDGVTRPEDAKDDKGESYKKYSLSVAILKTDPAVQELDAIAKAELANGQFKGQWKNGMNWPINEIAPTDYEGRLPSHMKINTISYRPVQVFDQNKQELNFMQYQNMLYPGSTVWVLVSPRSYDAKGNKGIGFWLSGVMIADATTPRLPVGGIDASKAFGALPGGAPGMPGPGSPAAAGPPAMGAPAAPAMPGPGAPMAPPAAAAPPAGPVYTMLPAAGAYTREQYLASGWTDEKLVQSGYMTVTQPAAPAMPGPGAPAMGAPGAPVAPAHDFLNGPGAPGAGYAPLAGPSGGAPMAPMAPAAPAGPQMTAKAGAYTYEQFIQSGWTDEKLRAEGYML